MINGTPAAPSFLNRVRFVDIDGSGTLDAVYGTGDRWRYVNLLADRAGVAMRPRLLRRVENGWPHWAGGFTRLLPSTIDR